MDSHLMNLMDDDRDDATAAYERVSSHCVDHHLGGEIKRTGDSLSSLPDEILQHILSLIPTKFAIRTSILSKRWRHVWFDTPALSFDSYTLRADMINQTLARYTARKMKTFQLCTSMSENAPYIDTWIQFAMSRNVENLSLDFDSPALPSSNTYDMPYVFYKQLSVDLHFSPMIPIFSGPWASLKKLSLRSCKLSDESTATITSCFPILESLTLYSCKLSDESISTIPSCSPFQESSFLESIALSSCDQLSVLDLSKSLRLRTLAIDKTLGPTQIVAPHIHYLRLTNLKLPCTLVDVSSLTEAKLDISLRLHKKLGPEFLREMLLMMLEKLQNVEKLSFGARFLQILSHYIFSGPFPSVKVRDLTFETTISQYELRGIKLLLQNSSGLKKLTLHIMEPGSVPVPLEMNIMNLVYLNVESKHVVFLMECLLDITKTIEKMVVRLACYIDEKGFEELHEMVPKLSHKKNVSIVLSSTKQNKSV